VLKADSAGEMSGEFFAPGLARYGMRPGHGLFRIFLVARNAVLRGADAFVAITDDVAAEFKQAGIDNSRVHRIPNAVDTDRFRPASPAERIAARQRLGLPPDAPVAIYTGRLVTYKGLPALLEAWTRLQPAHPDAHLVLLGEGGLDMHACEAELKEVVHARGLATRILFPGSVRNVEEYLRAADLFVFPTENDAFPSSLIEAMQTGLPVITTPVGAIREIVRHEDNGLLITPGDHAQLEQSLRRLLSDRELARSLGRSAWTSVAARFGADRVTERYLALFDTFRDRA
jgi:glycosyltransferase involved in cell wall biosynthesis